MNAWRGGRHMKAKITVRQSREDDPQIFDVDLDGQHFSVTLMRDDLDRLGAGRSGTALVKAAFHFLLDREPKEAILRQFDLNVIPHYFPEFERALPCYLGQSDDGGEQG